MVTICCLDSSCSFDFVLLFSHLNQQTPPKISLPYLVRDIFCWCCLYLIFSPTLYVYTCSTFLTLSCGKILKLVYLFLFSQLTRLAAGNLFCFLRRWLNFVVSPLFTEAGTSLLHSGACRRTQPQNGEGVSLAPALGCPHVTWEMSGEVLPAVRGWASCQSPKTHQQEPCSFRPLIFLSISFLKSSHSQVMERSLPTLRSCFHTQGAAGENRLLQ